MVVTPVVDQYLDELVARIELIFGQRLTGVWLLGSAAYGGFSDKSDLDVPAAIEGPPSSPEVSVLPS